MDIARVIIDDVRELLNDLTSGHRDLVPTVSALGRDARLAVPSHLGCVIVTGSEVGAPLVLTVVDDTLDLTTVGTSLRVPLGQGGPVTTPPESSSASVTFYAARPGDLTDLAADLLAALDLDPDQLDIDHPLPARTITAGLAGLDRFATVHRAIGVLIAQGSSPETARAQLRTASDPHARASTIINSTIGPVDDADQDRSGH